MAQKPMQTEPPHVAAHGHSSRHRREILASETCGCFYCLAVFAPDQIVQWYRWTKAEDETAVCPHCGIDSVIGSSSGYPITREFLSQMQRHWFG